MKFLRHCFYVSLARPFNLRRRLANRALKKGMSIEQLEREGDRWEKRPRDLTRK